MTDKRDYMLVTSYANGTHAWAAFGSYWEENAILKQIETAYVRNADFKVCGGNGDVVFPAGWETYNLIGADQWST